jgi:hypothetical protein
VQQHGLSLLGPVQLGAGHAGHVQEEQAAEQTPRNRASETIAKIEDRVGVLFWRMLLAERERSDAERLTAM